MVSMNMSEANKHNRLSQEKSPYLLQHAGNPVDWYPWGEEAFAKAIEEKKPIFLSIGYATCHWCHVMERETFSNPEIAALMNDTFINIKVDREEHPEVDGIYMEFAQALMSSAGGWPLNLVLTSDLKPFFAVTYLPPKATKGLIGIDQFISQIKMLWESEERSILVAQADKIVDLFKEASETTGADLPRKEDLDNAVQMLFDIADPVFGGIKGEPKFPLGYQAEFLLQYAKQTGDSRSVFFIELTMQMMARGGIFDHLGGGFSRYTVDEKWHIPHFEKMLCDNAILGKTYLEVYKYTKIPQFGAVCRQTLDYLLRDLRENGGGFFSAEDADSEEEEGKFYLWDQTEILDTLGPEKGDFFCSYFGVTKEGNFDGKSVLHVRFDPKEFSAVSGLSQEEINQSLYGLKKTLFDTRKKRKRPFKDDKVITSWNGLAIETLARAGFCFHEQAYLKAASDTADWIKASLWKEGGLLRRYRDGDARFPGGLEDYAFLIRGLLSLFETQGNPEHLKWAIALSDILEDSFKAKEGAFYQTLENLQLLIRKCEFYDGAEPSGNAVHCENLLRLYQLTQSPKYLKQAEDVLKAARTFIETFPPGACYHLIALQRYFDQKAPLVVVAYDDVDSLKEEIQQALGAHFCPHAFLLQKGKEHRKEIDELIPAVSQQGCINGKTTFYVCRGSHCEAPLFDLAQIQEAIAHL